MKLSDYFSVKELVCPDVYKRFGEASVDFMDHRLKETLLVIREKLGLPIVVNNWAKGGQYSQRGLRCNCCALVKEKTELEKVYLSAHVLGKAVDFHVPGMSAEEVRKWLVSNQVLLPYPIRVEDGVTWVHVDVMEYGMSGNKVTFFKG